MFRTPRTELSIVCARIVLPFATLLSVQYISSVAENGIDGSIDCCAPAFRVTITIFVKRKKCSGKLSDIVRAAVMSNFAQTVDKLRIFC